MVRADRFQSLAVRAHILGALDFCRSDRYDQEWRLKEDLVLYQLEMDSLLKHRELLHAQHASAAAGGGELYKHHFDRALDDLKKVREYLFPWLETEKTEKVNKHVRAWEQAFGIKMGSVEWNDMVERYERIAALKKVKV